MSSIVWSRWVRVPNRWEPTDNEVSVLVRRLECESRIATINRSNGKFERLGGEGRTFTSALPAEYQPQKDAVEFILNSRDLAVCLKGVAGSGKTDTLREIARGLKEVRRDFIAIASTHTAARWVRGR